MKPKKIKKAKPVSPLVRSGNIPVTQKMLYGVRNELVSKFEALDHRLSGQDKHFVSFGERFTSIDKRFDSIDKRFDSIDERFVSIDKRFDSIDRRFDATDEKIESLRKEMKGEFHKLALIIEEQNARNIIVLDGLSNLFQRQERVEKLVSDKFSST